MWDNKFQKHRVMKVARYALIINFLAKHISGGSCRELGREVGA